jgi:hypothetical protein
MKTILKTLAAGAAVSAALVQSAMASGAGSLQVPEPSSLPLVALAIGVAALVLRRKK